MKHQWCIRCPVCGRTRECGSRLAAFAFGRFTLASCTRCRRLRVVPVDRCGAFHPAGFDQRDQTWSELLAYVSEGTLAREVAEQIHNAPAPEERKREVAALVAEGSLRPEDAVAMLSLPHAEA